MAKERIQFVDSISLTAGIRLSLSSAPWTVLFNGTDISPPPLTRALNSTLLTDGAVIPASAYENRVVRLHIQLDTNDPTDAATKAQMLHRELNRATNILMWQPEPTVPPVFFKTFRAPDYASTIDYGINLYDFQIDIPAEPFSYGVREDVGPIVVSSDVTAGSNGRFFDLTGIKGDVETPLQLRFTGSEVASRQTVLAVRRRGTPSAMPFVLQAEAMTQGTDTATSAAGTSWNPPSGTNVSVTTFNTNAALAQRLSIAAFPTTGSVDARGTYRVFMRALAGGSGGPPANICKFEIRHGVRAIRNNQQTSTRFTSISAIPMWDMGLVQIPEGVDPGTNGPDGAALSVAGVPISVWIQRTQSTDPFTTDHLLFVPADDRFCIINWSASTPTTFVADGTNRAIYGLDSGGNITDTLSTSFVGDFPMVSPSVTNRVVCIRDVSPDTGNGSDIPSQSLTINVSYWPRYLTVRPLTT